MPIKLLILTQKVDINDDLLGFFHGWLEKIAAKVEQVSVIALYVGEYHLPVNVQVFSLGKEKYLRYSHSVRRLIAILRFYRYIWRLRKEYDSVFVHMNVEYVLLAGWLWRLLKKKIVLWYAHYLVDWRLKLAVFFSHRVVASTAFACLPASQREAWRAGKIKNPKLRIIGQGIDVDKFLPMGDLPKGDKFHILYLGRISKIKNLDLLIKGFSQLSLKYPNLFLDIIGASTPLDSNYYQYIQDLIKELNLSEKLKFFGKIPNYKTVEFYNRADLYMNLTRTGSFDKTSLEAMACQTPTILCNKAFYEYFDEDLQKKMIFEEGKQEDLMQKIENFLHLSSEEQKQIGIKQREIIKKYHSLDNLINNLIKCFKE